MNIGNNILITGGLGFIGSYFAEKMSLQNQITILDDFSAYSKEAYECLKDKKNIHIFEEDILNCDYSKYLPGIDTIFHFAANSNISSGVDDPEVDFRITTIGTHRLLRSMIDHNVKNLIFPSGSGVYGDANDALLSEDYAPLEPVSFYGASKLSAECFISAFCHMNGLFARVFRFGNVVGLRQTHGVAYDLIKKLRGDKSYLQVLGDGFQSKPYIHVEDIYNGIMIALENTNDLDSFDVFNLATDENITVREIVSEILYALDLTGETKVIYGDQKAGWLGDVPIYRLNTNKIRTLGWQNKHNSKQALSLAISYLIKHDFS